MMAESPITVLPKELMIEILCRVESSNPLQMRCVCKLWKSLVLDLQVMKKHYHRFEKHIHAFISQLLKNNLLMPQEQDAAEEKEKEEDDAAPDEDKLKQRLMNEVADLDKLLVKICFIKEDMKTALKVNIETEAVEDRLKCYRSFIRIYHKLA